MRPYEVFLHVELLDLIPKSGGQRRQILDFVRHLAEQPDTAGDFTDKDASLRERQIKIVGDYAVVYWLDAPVRKVMVVDIHPADQ